MTSRVSCVLVAMGRIMLLLAVVITYKKEESCFQFPSDLMLRIKWIKQVQRTRIQLKELGVSYVCVVTISQKTVFNQHR